ncbi:mitotic spindle assembly checkpoint protein MAD1-like [Anneissia japonica]|uniref:mitotic spindle assembly checkpoint protein MAD1-like n=1 Tax=Anneissia japonica TaxID=1529436 RepID=UPI0014256E9C|nr:mitotic spindle assembly checkpoint protein MAD1-like [Anneissia japonica]
MEAAEENTAVIRMMGEFEAYIERDIKKQRMEQIGRERKGEEILTQSYLTKLKNDMEIEKMCHKRSRLELESNLAKESIEKDKYSEKVVRLTQQLDYLSKQEDKKSKEVNELRAAKESLRHQYENQILDLRKQKLEIMTAHQELKLDTSNKISELFHKLTMKNSEVALLQTDLEGAKSQLQHQMRRGAEASTLRRALEQSKSDLATAHQTIRELQQKLSNQEEEATIAKAMCNDVKKLTEFERQNKQLKADLKKYRELSAGKMLADEKVMSLEGKLSRAEQKIEEFYKLQVQHEALQFRVNEWESCCNLEKGGFKSPMELANRLAELQQKELVLLGKQGMLESSSNIHQQAYKSASEKLASTNSRLLEAEMKNRQLEELAKRLQKGVTLLTKERDSLNQVLNTYNQELQRGGANAKVVNRLQQTMLNLQAYQKQVEELEANVKFCQEMAGKERLQGQQLQTQVTELKEKLELAEISKALLPLPTETSSLQAEELKTAKEKLQQVQMENQKLEERLEVLEAHMEQRSLQGDYDPTKSKVIHLKFNPTSQAKKKKVEDMEKLREECEKLRQRVLQLESQGTTSTSDAADVVPIISSKDVQDLQKELKASELRNQRLKEVFATKIQEFRQACYRLTGYQIDNPTTNKYCLKSMYAEQPEDMLLFQWTSSGDMQLLENEFSSTLGDFIKTYLQQQQSIPAFLSNITLDLFSKQTIITL